MTKVNGVIKLMDVKNSCKDCRVVNMCVSSCLQLNALMEFSNIVRRRRLLQRGERLFLAGDAFHAFLCSAFWIRQNLC